MPLLNRDSLKRPFSASHYVQTSEGVKLPDSLTSRAQWILSRSLCLFKLFAIDNLPSKNRAEALEVLVKRWAPFEQVGLHVMWTENYAGVWAWDETLVENSVEEVGVQLVSVLPETVYYSPMEEDGSRWIASQDKGYIFQIWVKGNLIAEKWFATKPNAARFELFIRTLEVPNGVALSWEALRDMSHLAKDKGEMSLLPTPWGAKNQNLTILQNLPWEQTAILASVGLLILAYAWIISATLATSISLSSVNQRVADIEQSVEPVLTARSTAELANDKISNLVTLIDYPSQINLLADVSKVLKRDKLVLKEWDFQGARIEVTTEGKVNTLNVVKKFEELTWAKSVSVSALRRDEQNKFTINIKIAE